MNKDIRNMTDEVIQIFLRLYQEERLACPHCGKLVADPLFVFQFLLLQNFYDKLFYITSFYRCPEYNAQIGGAIYSRHLTGRAVDIAIPDGKITEFVNHCKEVGITTVLLYPEKKFIHIDNQFRGFYINLNYHR
jgi:hypothetical protein